MLFSITNLPVLSSKNDGEGKYKTKLKWKKLNSYLLLDNLEANPLAN